MTLGHEPLRVNELAPLLECSVPRWFFSLFLYYFHVCPEADLSFLAACFAAETLVLGVPGKVCLARAAPGARPKGTIRPQKMKLSRTALPEQACRIPARSGGSDLLLGEEESPEVRQKAPRGMHS